MDMSRFFEIDGEIATPQSVVKFDFDAFFALSRRVSPAVVMSDLFGIEIDYVKGSKTGITLGVASTDNDDMRRLIGAEFKFHGITMRADSFDQATVTLENGEKRRMNTVTYTRVQELVPTEQQMRDARRIFREMELEARGYRSLHVNSVLMEEERPRELEEFIVESKRGQCDGTTRRIVPRYQLKNELAKV